MLIFIFSIFAILVVCIALIRVVSKLKMGWCKSYTCLVGKTILITGGNAGLGLETALTLASRGGKIIIADVVDTTDTVNKIKKATGNDKIVGKFLDLASLDSVRTFANQLCAEEVRLDILINNAGVGGLPLSHTADGLQIAMQINYFGSFLLTHLLMDLLKKSESKVIFISSTAAFLSSLNLENLNRPVLFKSAVWTQWKIYCDSKLCSLIASKIFAEKLRDFGVTCNAVHPGMVATRLFSNSVDLQFTDPFQPIKWFKVFVSLCLKVVGKTPYEGAQTHIYCALSKDLDGVSGGFLADCKPFAQPRLTKNNEFCLKLWQKSEQLVQLKEHEKIR